MFAVLGLIPKMPPGSLLKKATILHMICGSFDLVLQALLAYDGKMQTCLGNTYFARFTRGA